MVTAMRRFAATLLGALLLTGCIGSVSRSEFEAELQSRGGGLHESLITDVIDDMADRLGTDDFQLMSLSASPESAVVTMQVRDPRDPRNVDTYTFRSGKLFDSEPVRVSVDEDLDAAAIDVQDLALDQLNEMVDAALEAYDVEGAYVTSVNVSHLPDPDEPGEQIAGFRMFLESPRSTATALFDAEGTLLEVDVS
jgi:hypothetical protein